MYKIEPGRRMSKPLSGLRRRGGQNAKKAGVMRMPIILTLFRALFWVALPVIGAACTGVYCSEHARHDLAQKAAPEVPQEAKQPVATGTHFPDT